MAGPDRSHADEPPVLQPPGEPVAATTGAEDNRRLALWYLLAILITFALVVVFALPGLIAPADRPASAATPAPVAPPQEETGARERAQQALQEYLRLRARLELDNAPDWGEPAWSAAAAAVSNADGLFAQRRFDAAVQGYKDAARMLAALQSDRASLLAEALQTGETALAAGDTDAALAAFESALRIEPGNPVAGRGIEAARRRYASRTHMVSGRRAEEQGDLQAALSAYERALQTDGGHPAARAGAERIASQINTRKYRSAMTRALNALQSGRVGEADRALDEADRARPSDTAVRDARQRLGAIKMRRRLDGLRQRAVTAEKDENWQAAESIYGDALSVGRDVAFARTGLRRAEDRRALHAQFDHYLEKPDRLYSRSPRGNARKLLTEVGQAPADEPRLAGKIGRLRELLAGADAPVTLTLQSDGATSVTVYHVGRLGRFDRHRLQLLPGDYTVIGSRPGYRDVRKKISVRPGMPSPSLSIQCEETI